MIKDTFTGFLYVLQGMRLILQPGLRRFIYIPLGINIGLFSIGIYFLFRQFDNWMQALMPDFPDWLSWLESAIHWLLWPMFALMIIFIVFYGFTFVANIIAAPFNSLLAEKVEAKLLGRPYEDTSVIPLWSMIRHSLTSSLHSVMYMVLWSLLILIISFIPLINVAAPVLWFVFGAWMLALEYLDYPLGNHQHFFSDVKAWAKNNSMLSLSFGSGVFVITSIPLLNFIAMPAAVAAATALWLQREKS